MKTICFVNQKGGVAKTTSCLNIGAALARAGQKVLLVDMDPQGNLTLCAGLPNNLTGNTVYEALKGTTDVKDVIRTKHSADAAYDILPAAYSLSNLEVEQANNMLLQDLLKPLRRRYDWILIDCNPSLNLLTIMALAAADRYIIPVTPDYLTLAGITQIEGVTASLVKKHLNPDLKLSGFIVSKYDQRRTMDRQIVQMIQKHFPEKVYEPFVRGSVKLAEAPTFGKDIFEYAAKSTGAEAYAALAAELTKREGKKK